MHWASDVQTHSCRAISQESLSAEHSASELQEASGCGPVGVLGVDVQWTAAIPSATSRRDVPRPFRRVTPASTAKRGDRPMASGYHRVVPRSIAARRNPALRRGNTESSASPAVCRLAHQRWRPKPTGIGRSDTLARTYDATGRRCAFRRCMYFLSGSANTVNVTPRLSLGRMRIFRSFPIASFTVPCWLWTCPATESSYE